MNRRWFMKLLGSIGVMSTAAFGAPQMVAEPKKKDYADDDHVLPMNDSQIGSHDWRMDESKNWVSMMDMDTHIYRYTKLDEMVHRDVESGHYWSAIRMRHEENGMVALHGTRDDGQEIVARKKFVLEVTIRYDGNEAVMWDRDFDSLCDELDSHVNDSASGNQRSSLWIDEPVKRAIQDDAQKIVRSNDAQDSQGLTV